MTTANRTLSPAPAALVAMMFVVVISILPL
jgi:hypothetical protein